MQTLVRHLCSTEFHNWLYYCRWTSACRCPLALAAPASSATATSWSQCATHVLIPPFESSFVNREKCTTKTEGENNLKVKFINFYHLQVFLLTPNILVQIFVLVLWQLDRTFVIKSLLKGKAFFWHIVVGNSTLSYPAKILLRSH